MLRPDDVVEIYLRPGELYFGDRHTRLRTVLGSCVAVVFWHPRKLVGGMCHYVLPSRSRPAPAALDGRYGDEAFCLMLQEIRAAHTLPAEYRVRMFGGGKMFPGLNCKRTPIGPQNVAAARALMRQHCLNCIGAHVEGVGHRHLLFDVWSGRVTLEHAGPQDGEAVCR
ncbi:chemotaxis protein CheD [Zoogloea sp.]|uniref:chemotaxis protein CheD n=1 Tax=Zoogloea sp. TaxID=49181 RepID=UPI0014162E61|nr:MAG: chemotaxis protein CheD [Zoogloea sp.]